MRVLLLLNRKARRAQELGPSVREAFEAAGAEVFEGAPDGPDASTELMRRYGGRVDCVAVGGGDGTLIAAIPGLLDTGLPLGIVPLGTFNDLARTLGIQPAIEAAVRVILEGRTRKVDVGRVDGHYFINEASIGISTHIARKQTREVKKRFGFLAIIATTLTTLRNSRPFHVRVRYDGKEERFLTLQLTVANSHHFGGFLTNEKAAIDDGLLDLYSLEIRRWTEVLPMIWPIVTGKIGESPHVRNRRSGSFEVHTSRPRHVFTDGDPASKTPAHFEVLPAAIRVFVPETKN